MYELEVFQFLEKNCNLTKSKVIKRLIKSPKMGSNIHKIYVHHNYVKSHFEIDFPTEKRTDFKHLILTGKNGSGKSTLLRAINKELFQYKSGLIPSNIFYNLNPSLKKEQIRQELNQLNYKNPKVEIQFGEDSDFINEDLLVIFIPTQRLFSIEAASRAKKLNLKNVLDIQSKHIAEIKSHNLTFANLQKQITTFRAQIDHHKVKASNIEGLIRSFNNEKGKPSLDQLNKQLQSERVQIAAKTKTLKQRNKQLSQIIDADSTINPIVSLSRYFLQYLIDAKERQAFVIADDETKLVKRYNSFFKKIEKLFRDLYEDNTLKLKHNFNKSKFFFEFKNGVVADFNQIADGFKSVLVILAEILLQREAFMQSNNIVDEPSGIVLIDELEAHLHMSLQEKILPVLTKFFPEFQFIIATHSPQICASDRNSVVYDLTTNHLEKEYLGGISYDVLSKSHFGLPSEYSIETTKLLNRAKKVMSKTDLTEEDKKEINILKNKISEISPELAYEILLFSNKILST